MNSLTFCNCVSFGGGSRSLGRERLPQNSKETTGRKRHVLHGDESKEKSREQVRDRKQNPYCALVGIEPGTPGVKC